MEGLLFPNIVCEFTKFHAVTDIFLNYYPILCLVNVHNCQILLLSLLFSLITRPISVMSKEMVSIKQTDTKEISGIDGVNMKHPFAEVSLDDKLPCGALMCRHPH